MYQDKNEVLRQDLAGLVCLGVLRSPGNSSGLAGFLARLMSFLTTNVNGPVKFNRQSLSVSLFLYVQLGTLSIRRVEI